MAALLRSARILKLSPSGLLNVAGTNRTGPPLGRLYSVGVSTSRTGAWARLGRLAWDSVSARRVGPFTTVSVRRWSVATKKEELTYDVEQSKQDNHLDWALSKINNSLRRTGCITRRLLTSIFNDACRRGLPCSNQALLLLRSSGALLAEVPMAERTALAHRVWDKLQALGTQFDTSHYNALLKVYLQNEFQFSPTDFLAKMEAAKVQPNRVTYQRLIAAYCHSGNIDGASTILGIMKTKDLPITEAVFNSLLTGHARAGDIEGAQNILPMMQGAGIEPGPDTYVSLLNAYAEKGDIDSMRKTINEAESADCSLIDRDIMQVIFTLAKTGHQQHIPDMVQRFRCHSGFAADAINLCLSLITEGQDESAFYILKSLASDDHVKVNGSDVGNFFLRHCVNMDLPSEKILRYCDELQKMALHSSPLVTALHFALQANSTVLALELMKELKTQGFPIRQHYFFPLFTQNLKDSNSYGTVQVFQGMQELGVSPSLETMSTYVLPVFSSTAAAQEALGNTGFPVDTKDMSILEVCFWARKDLAKVYTLLLDSSFLLSDHYLLRPSLIEAFRKSEDVESMVKITELLLKDDRSKGGSPVSETSFFLYNLFNFKKEGALDAQEGKLREYLHQLRARNIQIPANILRGIRNLLKPCNVPELLKEVDALMNLKDQPAFEPAQSTDVAQLERRMAKLSAENKDIDAILKHTIYAHCTNRNLQRALELKQQYEEFMTPGSYANLINLSCTQQNVEEALHLKREMSRKHSSAVLDCNKYLALLRLLTDSGRMEEALDMVTEMKEKNVVIDDESLSKLFHLLNSVASKEGVSALRRLQNTLFSLGLVEPTANLCSPLVSAYLSSGDLSGALDAVVECQQLYKVMPPIHNLLMALVESKDMELLQKVMDYSSQERGEMNMLYDMFFVFLETGRYREARKIVETPGLRTRPGRLQWFADKCIKNEMMEPLEKMADMTSNLFECDRDVMYRNILHLCKNTNDWQKAEAVWTKMQEENVVPREKTLRLLKEILMNNSKEVPFFLPEVPEENHVASPAHTEQTNKASPKKKGPRRESTSSGELSSDTAHEEAAVSKDKASSRRADTTPSAASISLILSLNKKGHNSDALESLKTLLLEECVPPRAAVVRLVKALAGSGHVAGIQELEALVEDANLGLSSNFFQSNKALALIKKDDVDSAVELLESIYTSSGATGPRLSFLFSAVMNDGNEQAFDKLSAMAERLSNHFACNRPAVDLFLVLLENNKLEDARFMVERCSGLTQEKSALFSFISRKARLPGQVDKLRSVIRLVPDLAERKVLYSLLMKSHYTDEDLTSAKALHEEMEKEGVETNELTLKYLALLYHKAEEPVPFPEPTESIKFYTLKLRQESQQQQSGE